jgi:phage shock protein PspC (stress-responsive transcriptional regulator)
MATTHVAQEKRMADKKLTRSKQDNMIAGVMGGIANYLGWSPFKVRLLFVIVSCASVAVPGILIYLVLWFLMPMAEE